VEEADMNRSGNGRCIAAIGSVVSACALVLSGCGGSGGDDGTDTHTEGTADTSTNGTTDTSTSTTDDTTTLTRPSTTATTIENSP
jgi:hypothetical protein